MFLSTLAVCVLMAAPADGDLIGRIEQTKWIVNGKEEQRIERNDKGEVIRLRLNEMTITPAEFASLEKLTSLEAVTFYKSNIQSADLKHLTGLKQLRFVNLTSTEVTDAGVEHLVKIAGLKTICLGNVPMTPDGVKALKAHFSGLSLGYFQREPQ